MPLPFASPDRLLAHFQRTGDPRSLGRLFDRTAPELLRIAAWLAGNRADAEDLLQRTFLTVLSARGNFDAGRRAMPWLCGILGNHCRKLHEQRARSEPARLPVGERDPATAAADGEFAAAVARVRAELGPPYAEVLDLHLAEGLDAKRIAERLGRPAGTVRTQIVRGLELLRRHLPSGFVAGFVLTASANAAALAVVRSAVLAHAAPAGAAVAGGGGVLSFGGIAMGKKLAWSAAAAVLLGGSVSLWQQRDAVTAVPDATTPVGAQVPGRSVPIADVPGAPVPTVREEVAHSDGIAADPGFATLVVRMQWADDGTPASRVGVRVVPQPDRTTSLREAVTDDAGCAIVRRIRPGPCRILTTFTRRQEVELVADAVRTVELVARHDGFVEGRVVDTAGHGIATARLWLSDGGNQWVGFEVAHSDASGAFRVPFHDGCYLGARKAGYAPSRLRTLNARNAPIELVLPCEGGSVRGRVLDADGQPIVDARVKVGWPGGWSVPGSGVEAHLLEPTPAQLVTDPAGSFLCEGIEPGGIRVFAWATGCAPAVEPVLVEAGRTSEIAITLPRGTVVAGIVRDGNGKPVANAWIGRSDGERVVGFEDMGRPRTASDAAGRYRLEELPAGTVSLTAGRDDAKVTASIETRAGGVATWDPVLRVLAQLAGRIVGPDDRPLAGLRIGAVEGGMPFANRVEVSDAEGCFTLRGLETARIDVSITNDSMPIARRNGVGVGAEPLLVRLTADELPTASLRVRIVDRDRKPVAATVFLTSVAHGMGSQCTRDDDGVNRAGPVPAGRYTVRVSAPGFGSAPSVPVLLRANEECVLPDVVLDPAGRIEIRLAAGSPRIAQLRLLRDDGETADWLPLDGDVAKREVPPGSYRVIAQAGDGGYASVPIRVLSHEATTAILATTPAALVRFELRFRGVRPEGRVLIRVYDESNSLLDTYELHLHLLGRAGDADATRWQNRLPPGSYRFDARADDGRAATKTLTIMTVAETPGVVLELPPR